MGRGHLAWRRCDFAGRVNLLDSDIPGEDERSRFFVVKILLLLASEVTFRARKSRGFSVPARLTRDRSIGSLFMRRCWTPIEF